MNNKIDWMNEMMSKLAQEFSSVGDIKYQEQLTPTVELALQKCRESLHAINALVEYYKNKQGSDIFVPAGETYQSSIMENMYKDLQGIQKNMENMLSRMENVFRAWNLIEW